MTPGKLITLEGPDGCGKTTLLPLLERRLTERGIPCIATRQPGGTELGQSIRAALLDVGRAAVGALAELLLYEADRAQHVHEIVRPALAAGQVVLSDRYYDATTAYQGYGRGLDLAMVERLNEWATGGLRPDLTLLFDLDVAVGLNRIFRRATAGNATSAGQPDRLDREPLAFHERVRQGYLALAAREPHRFRIIPATGSMDETFTLALAAVETFLSTPSTDPCPSPN